MQGRSGILRAGLISFFIVDPAFGEELRPGDWSAFADADIVILGETHDNPTHHAIQADAVAALAPTAIVFEMLEPEQAARVTPELRDDKEQLADALGWEGSGWPDFSMYYPIFAAEPEAIIVGGALPGSEVRRAMSEGAAAVFGEDASAFGLDRPFEEELQADQEALQMSAHCDALPEEMLPGMVEAQRLRDAALARAVYDALEAEGPPVVLITGNGHADRAVGVPAVLAIALPEAAVETLQQFEVSAPEDPAADHWIVTEAAEREDPCEAFR